MKKTVFLVLFILCVSASPAQTIKQKHVPSIVVNAFQLNFPKASEVEWELQRGYYRVEFKIEERDHRAWLDYMGRLKKQINDLEAHELPGAVKHSIKKSFHGFAIHNVERIKEGNNVVYKMKLEKGQEDRRVLFNQEGKLLSNTENKR